MYGVGITNKSVYTIIFFVFNFCFFASNIGRYAVIIDEILEYIINTSSPKSAL